MIVHSEFSLEPNTTTIAEFDECLFSDMQSGYFGDWMYGSLSEIVVKDSHVESPETGFTFTFGGEIECVSSCAPGYFGHCEAVDDCWSCDIGVCSACPVGSYRAYEGAVKGGERMSEKALRGFVGKSERSARMQKTPGIV